VNHGFKYDQLEFKTLWSSPVTFWNLENLNFRALSFQFCKCSCHMFMTWSLPFSTAILTFWARSCYISINYRSTVYTYQNQIFHLIFSLPFSVNVKTAFYIFGQPTDHHSVNDANDIHSFSSLLICLILGPFWYLSGRLAKNFVQDHLAITSLSV
jgi:hypothetical protein